MKISASIYSDVNSPLAAVVQKLDDHGIDLLHIDCRDDERVFNDVRHIRSISTTPIDLHLITAKPEAYFDAINELGIQHVTLQHEALNGYKYRGGLHCSVGLGLTTGTGLEAFETQQEHFDFALIMATTPGVSGGQFDATNFQKIRRFKKLFTQKKLHVDGGVNAEVSFILRNMGVDAAVVGSFLFGEMPLGASLLSLKTNKAGGRHSIAEMMHPVEELPLVHWGQHSLTAVLEGIEASQMGFVMVAENGKLKGIVSNADLRREMLRCAGLLAQLDVERMLNKQPLTVPFRSNVGQMLEMVKTHPAPVSYLPVVDEEGAIKGAVSFHNLVKGEL